jgi:hypothetical protein
MNLPDRLFVFSYLLNQKIDPGAKASHHAAGLSLSLLTTLNLITLVNLGRVCFPGSGIFPASGNFIWILGGGTLLFWLGLFVRNQRYLRLIADYEALSAREKKRLWIVGYLHLIISFVLVIASFVPFVN